MLLRVCSVAFLVALLAAGCGGSPRSHRAPPKLPAALAQKWAHEADDVALAAQAGDGCRAQQLARSLAADVDANSARIPSRFQTVLLTAVTMLSDRIQCVQGPPKPPKGPKKPKKKHGPPGPGGDQ